MINNKRTTVVLASTFNFDVASCTDGNQNRQRISKNGKESQVHIKS